MRFASNILLDTERIAVPAIGYEPATTLHVTELPMQYSSTDLTVTAWGSRAQMQLARQDEDLEELGTHVERVGETATVINEELRSQNR